MFKERSNLQLVIILLAAISFILAELVIYFVAGQVNLIISNLFYLPVIIIAFRYPRHGVIFGVFIGMIYLIMVSIFTYNAVTELIPSVMQFYVFIIISILISSVASNMRLNEVKYEKIFKASGTPICLVNQKTHKLIEMNPEFRTLVDISGEPDTLPRIDEFIPDKGCLESLFTNIGSGTPVNNMECRFSKKNGKSMIVLLNANVLEFDDLALLSFADVTKSETALKLSETRYQTLVETAQEGIWGTDREGITTYVNPRLLGMLGYNPGEMLGKPLLDFIDLQEREIVGSAMDSRDYNVAFYHELGFTKKDGSRSRALFTMAPIQDPDREFAGYIAIVTDISEQKRYEKQLEDNLEEKSILIKEIHHRVKNNLQIISGLIRLQSRYIKNPQAIDALIQCQTRVSTMALVHESLYQSGSPANINAARHIEKLANMLVTSNELDSTISLQIDAEEIPLDMNTAVPASLVINELVLNAIKYAFPGKEKGIIRIGLHQDPAGGLKLEVADNGIGLPEGLDINTIPSLGLKLVTRLVRDQLKGQLDIDRTGGTRFIIRFPYTIVQDNTRDESRNAR